MLDDPNYEPLHPPVDGRVPDVVEKWGPRSQLRWFDRFRQQLRPASSAVWARFYCSSVQHRGECCTSCVQDWLDGYGEWDLPTDWLHPVGEEYCCCRALD